MASDVQLRAVITAKDEASSVVSGFGRSLDNAKTGSMALLGAMGALAIGVGVTAVNAFQESENTLAQLDAVLQSTGGAAGVTRDAAINLSKALQTQTTYSDEAVLSVENLLLTFTAISSDIMPEATETVLDMSVALGQDTKSSAIQLGKALQDPILGITALRRVGVNFSDAQKEVIKNLVETGRSAEAQQMILAELNKEFGGSAHAQIQTFAGAIKQLGNIFDDVMEIIGGVIVKAIRPLIAAVSDWIAKVGGAEGVMKELEEGFRKLQPYLPIIAGAIVGALVPAFWALAAGVWATLAPLLPFIAIGAVLGLAIKMIIDHLGGWDKTMEKLRPTINQVKEVIKELWDWVNNKLIPAFKDWWQKHSPEIMKALDYVWNAIKKVMPTIKDLKSAWDIISATFKNVLIPAFMSLWKEIEKMIPPLKKLWEQISPVLLPVLKVLAVIVGVVIVGAILIAIGALKMIIFWVTTMANGISKAIDYVKWVIQLWVDNWNRAKDGVVGVVNWIRDRVSDAINFIIGLIDKVSGKLSGLKSTVSDVGKGAFTALPKQFGGTVEANQPYIVGEHGAELFVPGRSGTIVPNEKVGGGGGNQITVNISPQIGMYAGTEMEKRKMASEILNALKDVANSQNKDLAALFGGR